MGNAHPTAAQSAERLEKISFNMKMASKTWEREAKKLDAKRAAADKKVLDQLKTGNDEMARARVAEAVSLKAQANQYHRLGMRLEAVAGRVDQAVRMKQFAQQMGSVTREMDDVLQCMDPEKLDTTMNIFVKQFEDLDVGVSVVSEAIDRQGEASTDQDEVGAYLSLLKDKHKDDLAASLRASGVGHSVATTASATGVVASAAPERIAATAGGGPAAPAPAAGASVASGQPPAPSGGSGGGGDVADALAARLAALRK